MTSAAQDTSAGFPVSPCLPSPHLTLQSLDTKTTAVSATAGAASMKVLAYGWPDERYVQIPQRHTEGKESQAPDRRSARRIPYCSGKPDHADQNHQDMDKGPRCETGQSCCRFPIRLPLLLHSLVKAGKEVPL